MAFPLCTVLRRYCASIVFEHGCGAARHQAAVEAGQEQPRALGRPGLRHQIRRLVILLLYFIVVFRGTEGELLTGDSRGGCILEAFWYVHRHSNGSGIPVNVNASFLIPVLYICVGIRIE